MSQFVRISLCPQTHWQSSSSQIKFCKIFIWDTWHVCNFSLLILKLVWSKQKLRQRLMVDVPSLLKIISIPECNHLYLTIAYSVLFLSLYKEESRVASLVSIRRTSHLVKSLSHHQKWMPWRSTKCPNCRSLLFQIRLLIFPKRYSK